MTASSSPAFSRCSPTFSRCSPTFSRCSLPLLLWGCVTVTCLVNTGLVGPQQTTPGYDLTYGAFSNTTYGDINRTFGYGNRCELLCQQSGGTPMACLDSLVNDYCIPAFKDVMYSLNTTDWCVWINVRSGYNTFTVCTESFAECLQIPWPNPLVEEIFVEMHSVFFQDCPTEELSDPPPGIVFALVMTPICLIPVMVVLVVLKTKNGDGSS